MVSQQSGKKTSLGRKLLKVVFGTYFFVALSVTIGQMYSEYSNVRAALNRDITELFKTSEQGMIRSVWNFDAEQIERTLSGLNKFNVLLGSRILDAEGEAFAEYGLVPGDESTIDRIEETSEGSHIKEIYGKAAEDGTTPPTLLQYSYHLITEDEQEGTVKVGTVYFYSSTEIVFNKVKYSFLLILINSLIKTFALWVIFLLSARMMVEKPLNLLQDIASSFNPDNPRRSGDIEGLGEISQRTDELGHLGRHFALMLDSIGGYVNKIKSFTANLENTVEQRTKELREKNLNIEAILQSMDFGVLTLDESCIVQPQISTKLCEILNEENPVGKTLSQVLLEKTSLPVDQQMQVNSVVSASVEDDSLNFNINKSVFPEELTLTYDKGIKELSIDWQAIVVDDIVTSVLVVIKDVTSQRKRQLSDELADQDTQILDQVISANATEVEYFLSSSKQYLSDTKTIILSTVEETLKPNLENILLLLHTLKGNARVLKFAFLVNAAHSAEEYFVGLSKDLSAWSVPHAFEKIEAVVVCVERYEYILHDRIMSFAGSIQNRVLAQKIKNIFSSPDLDDLTKQNEVIGLVDVAKSDYLSNILGEIMNSALDTCKNLDKPNPRFEFTGNYRIKQDYAQTIRDVINHCITNCLVHGIESREDRQTCGKKPQPTIGISAKTNPDCLSIEIMDDGRGLNLERLLAIGVEDGVLTESSSAEEIAEIIFRSGISTANSLTELAGRGVGMDAIRRFIEAIGGSVSISLSNTDGSRSTGCPFAVVINLPLGVIDKTTPAPKQSAVEPARVA